MNKKCMICKGKGFVHHTSGELRFPVKCSCQNLTVYGSPKYIEWFENQLKKIKEFDDTRRV